MKSIKLLFTLLFAAVVINGFGQIAGTAHDFSGDSWNTSGEMCIACHTPHNAAATVGSPLWNHEETTATFTLYSGGGTLDATMAQPTGQSKLCLSCHDGTVALDSYGGITGSTNLTGSALVGTTLANDHPVSFIYNTALASTDGGLFDPSVATTALSGTIDADLLFSGSLECASCHDVHNAEGNASLLRIENAASALCLTCHNK